MTAEGTLPDFSLRMVGISHRTAPVEVLEKLVIPEETLPQALSDLRARGLREAVVLSTCNRVEVYTSEDGAASGKAEESARQFLLARANGLGIGPNLFERSGERAVRHLFEVAAGLDSLVIGENEILGQVRQAYQTAQAAGFTGRVLNRAFQSALRVGKRVRSRTAISAGHTSIGSTAAALAERIFGDLRSVTVLLLGAGEMAEAAGRALASAKPRGFIVANRTLEKAAALAKMFRGRAEPLALEEPEKIADLLAEADVVIASTSAPSPIIHHGQVASALRRRRNRPIFFIDIAVPRNVDPAAHRLDNSFVYDIDDLSGIVAEGMRRRTGELEKARAIVKEEIETFLRSVSAAAMETPAAAADRP